MDKRYLVAAELLLTWFGVVALSPLGGQTIEETCKARDARTGDAYVRVAWTSVATGFDDVQIAYCVLRGDHDAKLSFERDAEIVYFALSSPQRAADRRNYTFRITTSTGRVMSQGPALLQPLARQPQSCRVDVCQFFTEPGERVVSVAVQAGPRARKR
ncbi:MAG TPA: hypothetical protein VF021_10230 [Longimicrobiales bacterium]